MKTRILAGLITTLSAAAAAGAGFGPDFDGRASGVRTGFAEALAAGPRPPAPMLLGAPYQPGLYETLPSGNFDLIRPGRLAPHESWGPEEREAEFLFIAGKLETVYSHLENKQKVHEFSYQALKADYQALVRAAGSDAEHKAAVTAFLDSFRDPHLQAYFAEAAAGPRRAKKVVTNTLTDDGILITKIARFPGKKEDILPGLAESLELAKTAKALVVDLRGNPGGNERHANWYLSRLAAHTITSGLVTMKISSESLAAHGGSLPEDGERPGWTPWAYSEIKPNTDKSFGGPVAVLIDGGCVSSCEGAAVSFKFSGLARLYGAKTRGSSGSPVAIGLPAERGELWVPTWIKLMPDETPIEDHGLCPDVHTDPRAALEAALADIRAALAPAR